MRRALITLAIDLPEPVSRIHRIFAAYAERHEMAFEVICEPRLRIYPNRFVKRRVWYHIEKFQLYDAFSRYDRILFVDSDILIQAHCPDLIAAVTVGQLGCVYDDCGPEGWKRREELARLERRMGVLPAGPKRYFNSGVMVLDASHRELFALDRKAFMRGRWPEQTLLNYRALAAGTPVHCLPDPCNFFPVEGNDWHNPQTRRRAELIHYAGQASKAQIRQDLPQVLQDWGLQPG